MVCVNNVPGTVFPAHKNSNVFNAIINPSCIKENASIVLLDVIHVSIHVAVQLVASDSMQLAMDVQFAPLDAVFVDSILIFIVLPV